MDKSKETSRLSTSILFLVFNRLETTKKVFESIKKAQPPKIYIASDGPRKNVIGEDELVETIRKYILQNINWNCEVKTLFREKNLGCKYAVSNAISWFFKNEKQGIILEDDCLPSESFFWFCEELLEKYKKDLRVWHISGDNFQDNQFRGDGTYYFSQYNHIWGWATWADRWQKYDVEMSSFKSFSKNINVRSIYKNKDDQLYWLNVFKDVYDKKVDTWDYQWTYAIHINNGLSILPNKNLISNIGFGENATHTLSLESEFSNIPKAELDRKMIHPEFILSDIDADIYTSQKMFKNKNIIRRLLSKINKLFN